MKPVHSNSVTITNDFVLAQPSMNSEQFCLQNLIHKAWVNPLCHFHTLVNVNAHWDCFPGLMLSRSHLFDKSSMGRFKPGSLEWNAKVLTPWPHIHSIANNSYHENGKQE